ncbi:bacteriophage abortive infection AbiH family protein [Pseudoalteromonas gelatinilytica]
MRVAYILGNGFDINLGLKTRYTDFYDYYLTKQSEDPLISQFKEHLTNELISTNKWSDLELSLGNYLENLCSIDEFDNLFDNIQDELAEYLKDIQTDYKNMLPDSSREEIKKCFLSDIFTPDKYLDTRDKDKLIEFYQTKKSNAVFFSIVNFNYTNTIESILGIKADSNEHSSLVIKEELRGKTHILSSLYHVHGSVFKNMILGVNDKSQINNSDFKENEDITNQFIKSECNLVQRHAVESKCEQIINEADVICIFGSSLGDTDRIWWDQIAKELIERECRLIIFEHNKNIRELNPARGNRRRRDLVQLIFGDKKPDNIEDKIYISFNSRIFMSSRVLPK